jgi:hypothetical protein
MRTDLTGKVSFVYGALRKHCGIDLDLIFLVLCSLVLDFDTEKKVGPWVVRTEIVAETVMKDSPHPHEIFLAKKAILSMETFMDGKVEYFVQATARPLVFRRFSKTDRPKAWKNCDLRIQSTLPVLGIDDSSIGSESKLEHSESERYTNSERLIRVSMALRNRDGEE